MPSANAGKRRVKKTKKTKALEENTNLNGPVKKVKEWKGMTLKKKCMLHVRAIPDDADSEDSQGGNDDDIGRKIE